MNLLTITQIAQLMGKSRQWVWFLIRTKQLKAEKIGNQYVVAADELDKLINQSTQILKQKE